MVFHSVAHVLPAISRISPTDRVTLLVGCSALASADYEVTAQ